MGLPHPSLYIVRHEPCGSKKSAVSRTIERLYQKIIIVFCVLKWKGSALFWVESCRPTIVQAAHFPLTDIL